VFVVSGDNSVLGLAVGIVVFVVVVAVIVVVIIVVLKRRRQQTSETRSCITKP